MSYNKNIMRRFAVILSWALLLQNAPLAGAAKPSIKSRNLDSLPSETLLLFHIQDMPTNLAQMRKSSLYKSLVKFMDSAAFMKMKEERKEAALVEELVFALLKSMPKAFTGEFTFAVVGRNEEERRPDIVFLAQVDEKEFRNLITQTLAPAVKKLGGGEIVIEKKGDLNRIGPKSSDKGLLFTVDDGTMMASPFEGVLKKMREVTEPLGRDEFFTSTFARQSVAPESIFFFNLREMVKIAGPPRGRSGMVLDLSGISSLASIACSTEVVENGAMNETVLYAPDGLTGVLGLLKGAGSAPTIEEYVPEDYTFFLRISVDSFSQLYKDLFAMLREELGEETFLIEDMEAALEVIQEKLGFSIDEDLLQVLGGNIGLAAKAPRVIGFPEMAMFIEVKDEKKLSETIEKLIPGHAFMVTSEYKGITISSTAVAMFQPAYAFVDGYLVVAPTPAVLRDIIDTRRNGNSIVKSGKYKAVFADLPEKGVIVSYIDLSTTFESLASVIQVAMMRRRHGPGLSPPAAALTMWTAWAAAIGRMPGEGMVLNAEKDAIRIKSFSGLGPSQAAVVAVGSALVVPAIFRARKQARRIVSLSNIKQLCLAQKQYALDYDEIFAEKFSDLYPDYASSPRIFLHPSSKDKRITKKEDIDKLCDYRLFPGLTEADRSDYILIYERDGLNKGEGRNVGYLDGSARWLTEEQFQRDIKAQRKEMAR